MILGIRGIEESSAYQDIFAQGKNAGIAEGEARGRVEGEVGEARKILLGLGVKKFGEPGESARAEIAAIDDLDRLDLLLARILDAASREERLATPGS